jgi:cytochrome b6-f complex iron-sulfur subunit
MPSRRKFVSAAGASVAAALLDVACGAGAGGFGLANCTPPANGSTVTTPLPDIGGTVAIDGVGLGCQGVAVTRLSATSVVAVSRQCTHQGCTLALPGSPGGTLFCPCHGSRFTPSGGVLLGPAIAPLQTYPAQIGGTNVIVTVS